MHNLHVNIERHISIILESKTFPQHLWSGFGLRMEHCKKACRACAMSHWGLGGDLLLVLHTTVVVQTLRFAAWLLTRCWDISDG